MTLSPRAYATLLTLRGVTSMAMTDSAKRHLLVSAEGRCLQLLVCLDPQLDRQRVLTDAVLTTSEFMPRVRSLACFNDLLCSGNLLGRYFPPEFRQQRLAVVLRCLDAALHAAPHRDIAIAIYGRKRVDADWGDPREHLRDSVRRAIARGRTLMRAGYMRLLR